MRTQCSILPGLGLALGLLLVACTRTVYVSGTPYPTYTPYPAPTVTLSIVDDFFQESDIVVVKGTKVIWVNEGEHPHTATGLEGSPGKWDTGLLMPGQRGEHVFDSPGVYLYYCKVHEYMRATIRVVE